MGTWDIIIYAAIAAFLFYRLWSVLGQRDDGTPSEPRQNPFASKEEPKDDEENVMVLEGRARPISPAMLSSHAPTSLAGSLDQIRVADPAFNEKQFIEGAKTAFQRIVGSFAVGDLSPVVRFLGPSVREPFEMALRRRKETGQAVEGRIEKIIAADIVAARAEGAKARLTVEFVSHQVNITRDAQGNILEGTPGRSEEVRDVWVFERDVSSPDPNWTLIETHA
jgi:predicted lipid-binding transport protein (Tim44 family)